jgi:hypothetical protein
MSLPLRADPVPVSSQAIFRLAREHPVRCLCMIESHGGSPSDSSASLPKYDGLIRRLRLMQKSFATHNTIKSRGQAFIGRPNPHGRSSAPPRGAAFRPLHWKNGGWRFGWSAGFRTVKRPKCRAPTDLRCGGANGSLPAVCASRTAGFQPAVSPISKSAGRPRVECRSLWCSQQVWKPARRQTGKSAAPQSLLVPAARCL